MKFDLKDDGKRILLVIAGALLAGINMSAFVNAGGLFPGGVNGLTVLIIRLFRTRLGIEIPYLVLYILLNAIPIYIGFRFVGKKFTLYSMLAIVLTAIFVQVLPPMPVTDDMLLISVFGGIINGVSACVILFARTTAGGTDLLSIAFSEQTGRDSWNIIFIYNCIILTAAGFLFGWDKALYSIIYQFTTKQVMQLLYRHYQQQTMLIVTNKADEICKLIYSKSHHGATILPGTGSYEGDKRDMVYSVIAGDEQRKVITAVKKIDPHSFINVLDGSVMSHFYKQPRD